MLNTFSKFPLNVQVIEDFIAWKYTRSGAFSVRSAYHREWEHHHGQIICTTDGQGSVDENPVWKEIWRLRLLGKIKIFSRKVLHGVLPCYGVLVGRHIRTHVPCLICVPGPKDIKHCFLDCARAKDI